MKIDFQNMMLGGNLYGFREKRSPWLHFCRCCNLLFLSKELVGAAKSSDLGGLLWNFNFDDVPSKAV